MRTSNLATLTALSALLLGTNACSLLGTYASSAQSMMAQPSAATTPASPAGATPTTTPSTPTTPEKSAESKAPSSVSVSLHNGCKETVKLFFGAKPKFGSGRYSSLSSNTRTNESFRPGDQLWIVDDGQNGVSNVTIGDTTREIEIASSCDELRAK